MTQHVQWVKEKWKNIETRYRIKRVLYEENGEFQHIQLVDTHEYGKMLLLDGIVQTTEKDEFFYHEMMVHVPMLAHPDPKQVLIIGGGDGGILREVLRHPQVEKTVMVEIDSNVVDFSKKYLPSINNGAFEDKRAKIIFADGAGYVEKTDDAYDVVIVDSPDPIGPAQVLFSEKFYVQVHQRLNSNGIMVRQTGSLQIQADEQKQAHKVLRNIFTHVAFYVYCVPTYIGGLFSSVFCSESINPKNIRSDEIQTKVNEVSLETTYYNPGIHIGSFHLPQFFKNRLK
ncbi:MAG: polyamine aminopropyltransferase [Desulfobacterales bacterium]